MRNLFRIIPLIIVLLVIQSCNTVPAISEVPYEKIQVRPGPEDMVLDTLNGTPRLIISCSARRKIHKSYGEIVAYNLLTGNQVELVRYNEPTNITFHPHGIYLDRELLYVISHEMEPDYHPILIYRLHADSLEFKELIHTPRQHSPNALVTGPYGEIYFVNDSGKRGSMAEKVLRLRRASVVRLEKDSLGNWGSEYMAADLGYPAGINRIEHTLYVGDAILNQIHVFDISTKGLTTVTQFKDLPGNDNIRLYKGMLLTTCHIKPFKFIKHTKDPEKLSPVEVFQIDPESGTATTLYHTDGSSISAGSTAIIFEDFLYISQIFNPYILKVSIENKFSAYSVILSELGSMLE